MLKGKLKAYNSGAEVKNSRGGERIRIGALVKGTLE
jgi:hypothetical protein